MSNRQRITIAATFVTVVGSIALASPAAALARAAPLPKCDAKCGNLDLTRFDGHLTRPKLRAEVFNDSTTEAFGSRSE